MSLFFPSDTSSSHTCSLPPRICTFKQIPREFLTTLYFYNSCLKDMMKYHSASAIHIHSAKPRHRWHQWALSPQGWTHDCKLLWVRNFIALQTERKGKGSFSLLWVAQPWWRVQVGLAWITWPLLVFLLKGWGLDNMTTAGLPTKMLRRWGQVEALSPLLWPRCLWLCPKVSPGESLIEKFP